ncbi:MAG: 3-hydroxybutyrate dehydrogenase [Lentisphaerota bacterium]
MSCGKSLSGKVAIVTGASRGIGYGLAEKLASEGANIVVVDIAGFAEAAAELQKRYSVECIGVKIDVSDEKCIQEGINSVFKHFGHIDILVNNAGVQHIDHITDFDTKAWKFVTSIQIDGTFFMVRECMKIMKQTKTGGRIVNIGSVHSFLASANKCAYVASKHALLGITRSVAVEGAEFNIAGNLVAPGYVLTDLVKKQIPERMKAEGKTEQEVIKSMLKETIDGEFTTVEEVADAVAFFAGAKTLAYSGQSMIVSHGFVMD